MKKLLLTFLFLFGLFATGVAQITISPTHVFVDSRTRFGSYMVINGSDEAQEISIDFLFGYTASDDEGNLKRVQNDSVRAAKFSAAQWIRAFPKNFILQPGERQTVRLRVAAPEELPDKVYWARISTTSSPLSTAVGTTNNEEGVTAQIGIELQQIISLYYKAGDVQTGIVVEDLKTKIDQDSMLWVAAQVDRTGNAPFLGTIYATVYNQNNEKVARSLVSTTLYFDGLVKRPVNISGLPAGNYTAEIRFETQRRDIPARQLVQMPPVEETTRFTIE